MTFSHLVGVTLTLLLCLIGGVQAATIAVTTAADLVAPDGACSLREATLAAAQNQRVDTCPAGSPRLVDTLRLPAGLYAVDAVQGTLTLAGRLVVRGVGTGRTQITGQDAVRPFTVAEGAAVRLQHLTVEHGFDAMEGGAVSVPAGGELVLDHVLIRESSAEQGGGLFVAPGATVMLFDTALRRNHAWFYGGGILNAGTLILRRVALDANLGEESGGGLTNWGAVRMYDSTVTNNQAPDGAPLTLPEEGLGGGIMNSGNLRLERTSLTGNQATFGGALFQWQLATGPGPRPILRTILRETTVQQNTAEGGGGGIWNQGGFVDLKASRACENLATHHRVHGTRVPSDIEDVPAVDAAGTVLSHGTTTVDATSIACAPAAPGM